MTFTELRRAALTLPHDERVELMESLFFSLDDKEQEAVDAAWAAEIDRRSKEIKAGKAKLIPADEVMRSLQSDRKKPGEPS